MERDVISKSFTLEKFSAPKGFLTISLCFFIACNESFHNKRNYCTICNKNFPILFRVSKKRCSTYDTKMPICSTFNIFKYFHVWMISDMYLICPTATRELISNVLKSITVTCLIWEYLPSISWATHPLAYRSAQVFIRQSLYYYLYGPLTCK